MNMARIFRKAKEDDVSSNVDFRDFLKFMSVCESAHFTGTDRDAEIYENFKNLIQDLNKTVICGSSVLNYRLSREPDSEDIDFFVEGTITNSEILSSFFNNAHFKKVFEKFSKEHLPKPDKEYQTYAGGNFEKTSYEATYNLVKLDYKIETYRFGFSSIRKRGFNLNFILPRQLNDSERSIVGVQERLTTTLYTSHFLDDKGDFVSSYNSFSFNKQAKVTEEENKAIRKVFPVGLPLHIINDSFDFEELKYVYSFELQQSVSTFMAAKMLMQKFKEDINQLHTDMILQPSTQMEIIKRVDEYIINLETRNKQFMETTSDPSQLTLSTRIIPEGSYHKVRQDVHSHATGIALASIFGQLNASGSTKAVRDCYSAYHNIMVRVPKYEARGFTIVDNDNFLADLQAYITMHTMHLMANPSLNNIAKRSCLLAGDRAATSKMKLLRESYKAFASLVESTNTRLTRDPEKEEHAEIVDAL